MANRVGFFSCSGQLEEIAAILQNYARLPFTDIHIPGAVMEGVLAHVRHAEVLRTYDFIDVLDRSNLIGWQVKSTLAATPVTWKRAKIPNSVELIARSEKTRVGLQELGNAIIGFCNAHAQESIDHYGLKQIGYARLILHRSGDVTYFERLLCTKASPTIFDPAAFTWKWSKPKVTKKKEQLSALHGIHAPSGEKWFAWHGRGENQLHFSGERAWWPDPSTNSHGKAFKLPVAKEKLSIEDFVKLLAASGNPLPLP